jgi:hypothetical protein
MTIMSCAINSMIIIPALEVLMALILFWFQKTDNPVSVNEFRPISLLNSSIKLITKIQFQLVILNFVHQNQYGFVKNKSMHNYLAWSFEYLVLCHRSKKKWLF